MDYVPKNKRECNYLRSIYTLQCREELKTNSDYIPLGELVKILEICAVYISDSAGPNKFFGWEAFFSVSIIVKRILSWGNEESYSQSESTLKFWLSESERFFIQKFLSVAIIIVRIISSWNVLM